jgi:SAM-dependent methyltransferase
VHGIDASPAMVERMRAKPGGDAIAVTIGDMADVPVDGRFALVFVVFNTFFQLYSQDTQLRCFANVADHLHPSGRFVIHAFVPDTSRVEAGQHLAVKEASLDRVRLDASVFDAQEQRLDTTQVRITEDGIRLVHAKLRFAWPPELDLMARLAGLTLEDRWATFGKQPFTGESAFHVSVYRA